METKKNRLVHTRSLAMMVLGNMGKVDKGIWQATKSASNLKHKVTLTFDLNT